MPGAAGARQFDAIDRDNSMIWRNPAGRAGAWAAANPRTALLGWLAFVAIAVALGAAVGTKATPESESTTGESARAEHILSQSGLHKPGDETVLVTFTRLFTPTSDLYATVRQVTRRLRHLPQVRDVRSPLKPQNEGLIAWDLRSALIPFRIRGGAADASKKVQPVLDAVAAVQKAHPELLVSEFGGASSAHALDATVGKDFRRAELTTVPLTILILLVAFGALFAAGLPVLLAMSGVLATVGLAAVMSHVVPASAETKSVILLVGMAVGIDYSLFYIRREREERAKGLSHREAVLKTASTSGNAVLVSGLTVMIAMAGMFFSGSTIFTSFAVGTMLMVAVALIGSLTVLPALLSKLGDRVDKGRIPFLVRNSTSARGERFWSYVLDRVLRRPALSVAVTAGALILLAAPALTLHTELPSFTDLPASLGIAATHYRIQTAFGAAETPAIVAVKADLTSPRVKRGIIALKAASTILATGEMTQPIEERINANKTAAAISISLKGNGTDRESKEALATLRDSVVPSTIGRVPAVSVAVTGTTAATSDFNRTMAHRMPIVFGFVLLLVFLLLLVTFRSIVIPIKAVILNLLSVGAAYGVLVLVFQHHWAEGILGFHSNGAIVAWLPMFVFVILFGLSMDYHVFILSRVKELVDGGMSTDDAVEAGIKQTAPTVTSAALIMVAIFAIFATLNLPELKQMGVGLAAAILIDATVVRAVLLPATMKLLGEWNWYFPSWLERLPRIRMSRAEPVRKPEAPGRKPDVAARKPEAQARRPEGPALDSA
jgi:RND superfamily putative drug exporter